MIAGCPRCSARYRIAREQIRPEGVRLRCQRCQAAFRVRAPAPPATPTGTTAPEPTGDRRRRVVLADPDPERAKLVAAALSGEGLEVVLAHDGVEAILTIQRVLPRAVVLHAALPKMFGFQVCELMKRNASLREISVVLVGSVHRQGRYRRPPGELYGADAYLEEPDLGRAVLVELRRMGLPVSDEAGKPEAPGGASPTTAPAAAEVPSPPPPTAPEPEPSAPETPAAPAAPAPELPAGAQEAIAKAERLARIIVSDIILYNEEKFAAALASGDVATALEAELEEGRALFRDRVEPEVREARDFLTEELLRVARTRGGK